MRLKGLFHFQDGRFVTDRDGGIVILFGGDSHDADGLIMSPFNNFMAMHNVLDLDKNQLYYGAQGGTKDSSLTFIRVIAQSVVNGMVVLIIVVNEKCIVC